MAKLTLTDILTAFQSTAQLNANSTLIEAAFENTLSRDGTSPNEMNANLDMNGYAIVNASILNVADDETGVSISDGVGYAQEWAQAAEDTYVSAAAGGGTDPDDYSALHFAAKATASATTAEGHKDDAETAETGAETTLETFNGQYYGAYANEAALGGVDPNGNAFDTGDQFWDESVAGLKVYTGAAWELAATTPVLGSGISLADAADYYTVDNVEAALQEVFKSPASRKWESDGGITGNYTFSADPTATGTNGYCIVSIEGVDAATSSLYFRGDTSGHRARLSVNDTCDVSFKVHGSGLAVQALAIEGTTGKVTLPQGASIGGLNTLVLDIGDWDMSTATGAVSISVAHGLTATKIRSVSALIRHDNGIDSVDFNLKNNSESSIQGITITTTNINLYSGTGGRFDSSNHNATSFNRGWITIQYVD